MIRTLLTLTLALDVRAFGSTPVVSPPSSPVCDGHTHDTSLLWVMSRGVSSCAKASGIEPASNDNTGEAVAGGHPDGQGYTFCYLSDGTPASAIGDNLYTIPDLCPQACDACGHAPVTDLSDEDAMSVVGPGNTCATLANSCSTNGQVAWMCPETCGATYDECEFTTAIPLVLCTEDCVINFGAYYSSQSECEADCPNWVAPSNPDGWMGHGQSYQGSTAPCAPIVPEEPEELGPDSGGFLSSGPSLGEDDSFSLEG